jgi:hypothetical protein
MELVGVSEAAALLRCCTRTVGLLIKRGVLRPAYRSGRNMVVLRRADVVKLAGSYVPRRGRPRVRPERKPA